MSKEIKFGTGGWRAVIGKDFTCENVRRVATGIVRLMHHECKTSKPVIIGYDRRFLSDEAAKWVAEVLAAYDIQVYFLNRSAPTPLIMHAVKDKGLYYGIEITASHNPSEYNGIKLIIEEGRDADLNTTSLLEKLIMSDVEVKYIDFSDGVERGLIQYLKNPFNEYIDDILGQAYFGGMMPAPTEHTLSELKDDVVRGGYDMGIALDGDGDRLGIIDNNGRYITANEILCMLYYYLVKYQGWTGPVVRNLATTHMLDRIAESFGEKCYEVPVGFKYISSKIDEVNAVLGGESSGGLTVRGHIHGKDSVYAASLFAEMISVIGKSPSEIMADLESQFGKFYMVEDNLRFEPERKVEINQILMVDKKLPEFNREVVRVNYEDGCKVYFDDDSFVICRFSGTEPLLRIFAESHDKAVAEQYIKDFKSFLNL